MNFAGLVQYFRSFTAKFQPNWCKHCWDMNFLHIYILQKLKTRFSQKYIFQDSHFVCSFFRFFRAICLVFFGNMLIWVPTTQFCEKLKIHFSDIGNLFQERITYILILFFLLWFLSEFTLYYNIFNWKFRVKFFTLKYVSGRIHCCMLKSKT